jgi:hypothetical protein
MILLRESLRHDYFFTIEYWEEDENCSAYLLIWQWDQWRGERMIRRIICNGWQSALGEAEHWIEETIYLKMQAKADGHFNTEGEVS